MRYFKEVRAEKKKHSVKVQLPKMAAVSSAAYDFFSPCSCTLYPRQSKTIWTDVKVHLEDNELFDINVQNSMGEIPIMLANTQSWIDPGYYENKENDGNIGICFYNLSDKPYEIHIGDKIAQGRFLNFLSLD